MYAILRIAAAMTAAALLVACAASTQGTNTPAVGAASALGAAGAPPDGITNPPSNSLPKRHAHMKPNDVVGGGIQKLLQILLCDAPLPAGSNVAAIDLGIDEILATTATGGVTTVAQYTSPQVVNVLAYQGGATTPIAYGNVAPVTYTSLTIVVDTASSNFITTSGNTGKLKFGAGQATKSTSGFGASTSISQGPSTGTVAITFNKAFQVQGSQLDLDVDFNALESIDPSNWSAYSRPALTVAQEGYEGAISGTLANAGGAPVSNAVVTATGGDGSVDATAVTDANGNFQLHTLVADQYQLSVYNAYETASGLWVSAQNSTNAPSTTPLPGPNAGVTPGQTTSVGTIQD